MNLVILIVKEIVTWSSGSMLALHLLWIMVMMPLVMPREIVVSYSVATQREKVCSGVLMITICFDSFSLGLP
jgi:hypothetical protein